VGRTAGSPLRSESVKGWRSRRTVTLVALPCPGLLVRDKPHTSLPAIGPLSMNPERVRCRWYGSRRSGLPSPVRPSGLAEGGASLFFDALSYDGGSHRERSLRGRWIRTVPFLSVRRSCCRERPTAHPCFWILTQGRPTTVLLSRPTAGVVRLPMHTVAWILTGAVSPPYFAPVGRSVEDGDSAPCNSGKK